MKRSEILEHLYEVRDRMRAAIRAMDESIELIEQNRPMGRSRRLYDAPPPSAEEVAEKYGVDLSEPSEGEVPSWFQERLAGLADRCPHPLSERRRIDGGWRCDQCGMSDLDD